MAAGSRGKAPQRRPSLTNRQPALETTAPKRAKTATAKRRRRANAGAPSAVVERDELFGKSGHAGQVQGRAAGPPTTTRARPR